MLHGGVFAAAAGAMLVQGATFPVTAAVVATLETLGAGVVDAAGEGRVGHLRIETAGAAQQHWERDGKQYVTVASGIGGVFAIFSGDERLQNIPPGGSLWTFALFDEKQ